MERYVKFHAKDTGAPLWIAIDAIKGVAAVIHATTKAAEAAKANEAGPDEDPDYDGTMIRWAVGSTAFETHVREGATNFMKFLEEQQQPQGA